MSLGAWPSWSAGTGKEAAVQGGTQWSAVAVRQRQCCCRCRVVVVVGGGGAAAAAQAGMATRTMRGARGMQGA
eukprot:scaffold193558_cov15-Tisochrysis_lutea.AAC.2